MIVYRWRVDVPASLTPAGGMACHFPCAQAASPVAAMCWFASI